jgi:integrase
MLQPAFSAARAARIDAAEGQSPEDRADVVATMARFESASFHDLRHFYASLLIARGASVREVQDRLGHANAAETLNTYSHLWPDSDDRTRDAVQAVLGAADEPAKPQAPDQAA